MSKHWLIKFQFHLLQLSRPTFMNILILNILYTGLRILAEKYYTVGL